MMLGIDTGRPDLADAVCQRCYANGLIIETAGPRDEVIKSLAPLTTPDKVLHEGLAILDAAITAETSRAEAVS